MCPKQQKSNKEDVYFLTKSKYLTLQSINSSINAYQIMYYITVCNNFITVPIGIVLKLGSYFNFQILVIN